MSGNIKDYGVIGDGVADDTEAIQKAINENEIVHFPHGAYKTTKSIKFPRGRKIK